MTDIQSTINDGWARHTENPRDVLSALEAVDFASLNADEAAGYLKLYAHVQIAHLGDVEALLGFVKKLEKGAAPTEDSRAVLHKYQSLAGLCAAEDAAAFDHEGFQKACAAQSPNLCAELYAQAAMELSHLAYNPRSVDLFDRAMTLISTQLSKEDPSVRPLAIATNNLATSLSSIEDLSAPATDLMLRSAHKAREFWGICGTEVHVERAEYRLAHCYLKAQQYDKAIHHARECERICLAHDLGGVELFHASATLATIHHARCAAIYTTLTTEEQSYCPMPSLTEASLVSAAAEKELLGPAEPQSEDTKLELVWDPDMGKSCLRYFIALYLAERGNDLQSMQREFNELAPKIGLK